MKFLYSLALPFTAALAAGFFASAPAASAASQTVNGSFEAPAYPAGTINPGGGDVWIPSFMGAVSIISGNIRDSNGQLYGVTPTARSISGSTRTVAASSRAISRRSPALSPGKPTRPLSRRRTPMAGSPRS